MHNYLKRFPHFTADAQTLSLRGAKVVVPVYKDNKDTHPKLAVIGIEPIYGSDFNLGRAYHDYVTRFMVNVHGDDTTVIAAGLASSERIFKQNDRGTGNPPRCIARPRVESVELACSLTPEMISKNILCDVPGSIWHIGALFSAIQTLGHIVTADLRQCEFPLYCMRHLPPIKLTKLEALIDLEKPFVIPRMYNGQFNISITPAATTF